MDYKSNPGKFFTAGLFFFTILYFLGCNENQNNQHIYYIEVVNCSDSLKNELLANITGKTSFIKNNKVEIFSLNYITEKGPEMHYYKEIEKSSKNIKAGTKKISIEFSGDFTYDSTLYSIQKFTFIENQWKKTSDIGIIRAISTKGRTNKKERFEYPELVNQIVNNVATSTH